MVTYTENKILHKTGLVPKQILFQKPHIMTIKYILSTKLITKSALTSTITILKKTNYWNYLLSKH